MRVINISDRRFPIYAGLRTSYSYNNGDYISYCISDLEIEGVSAPRRFRASIRSCDVIGADVLGFFTIFLNKKRTPESLKGFYESFNTKGHVTVLNQEGDYCVDHRRVKDV